MHAALPYLCPSNYPTLATPLIYLFCQLYLLPSHPIPTTHIHLDSYVNRAPLNWTCCGIATRSSSHCCISGNSSCSSDSHPCSTVKKERENACSRVRSCWNPWNPTVAQGTKSHLYRCEYSVCQYTSQ